MKTTPFLSETSTGEISSPCGGGIPLTRPPNPSGYPGQKIFSSNIDLSQILSPKKIYQEMDKLGRINKIKTITLFEFSCTGQVYLPVVAVLQEGDRGWSTALGYLLLYNLLFIAPLFVLIFLFRLGTSSARLAAVARRQGALARLFLALFSWFLAGILLSLGR